MSILMKRFALGALTIVLAVGLFFAFDWGGNDANSVELSEDQILRLQFKAVEQLRELGCEVKEVDDKWLAISGVMVRLYPEHFTDKGHIRNDVKTHFRHLINCFLVMDRTPISDEGILPLRDLNNLRLLSVQGTGITNNGLSNIHGIVSLQLLRMNWTLVDDDGLKFIDRLPNLVMLYLSGTKVTDKSLKQLVDLKKLAALQFSHVDLTDDGLPFLLELKKLEYLGLDNTKITDASVPVLAELGKSRKLVYLDITGTGISTSKVRELTKQLPECMIVARPTLKLLGDDSTDHQTSIAPAKDDGKIVPPIDVNPEPEKPDGKTIPTEHSSDNSPSPTEQAM